MKQRLAEKSRSAEQLEQASGSVSSEACDQSQPGTLKAGDDSKHEHTAGDGQSFIAFARVFSGTVRPGLELYVLGPKHNPAALVDQVKKKIWKPHACFPQ